MYLCLDLSLKSTGYALFNSCGELREHGKIVPDSDLTNPQKILFIVKSLVKTFYDKSADLIIENVYLGITGVKNLVSLSRLAGAVIYSWKLQHETDPIFKQASQVRPVMGLKGNCQKAEVQLFVLRQHKFASNKILNQYDEQIKKLHIARDKVRRIKVKTKLEKKQKKRKLAKLKYEFDKLSKEIENKTHFGEDVCDSILLGMAFYKAKREKLWEN